MKKIVMSLSVTSFLMLALSSSIFAESIPNAKLANSTLYAEKVQALKEQLLEDKGVFGGW